MKLVAVLGLAGIALAIATILVDPESLTVPIWLRVLGLFGASACALAIAIDDHRTRTRSRDDR